jgi:hypothetical protein
MLAMGTCHAQAIWKAGYCPSFSVHNVSKAIHERLFNLSEDVL